VSDNKPNDTKKIVDDIISDINDPNNTPQVDPKNIPESAESTMAKHEPREVAIKVLGKAKDMLKKHLAKIEGGTPAENAKYDRCVEHVKEQGGKAKNPYAICHASLKKDDSKQNPSIKMKKCEKLSAFIAKKKSKRDLKKTTHESEMGMPLDAPR
jgi:hypothetical protein